MAAVMLRGRLVISRDLAYVTPRNVIEDDGRKNVTEKREKGDF